MFLDAAIIPAVRHKGRAYTCIDTARSSQFTEADVGFDTY